MDIRIPLVSIMDIRIPLVSIIDIRVPPVSSIDTSADRAYQCVRNVAAVSAPNP